MSVAEYNQYKQFADILSTEFNIEFKESELATYDSFMSAWNNTDMLLKQLIATNQELDKSDSYWKDFNVVMIPSKIFCIKS